MYTSIHLFANYAILVIYTSCWKWNYAVCLLFMLYCLFALFVGIGNTLSIYNLNMCVFMCSLVVVVVSSFSVVAWCSKDATS